MLFRSKGSQIVLSPRGMTEIADDLVASKQQEERTIQGTVVDTQGEPIIGANVIIKGSNTGTITDLDGNFSLNVPSDAVLRITYIGYLEQEVSTQGKNRIDVTLEEDTQTLDEVVVVGYGTMKKINLTGAVASVDGSSLNDRMGHSTSQMLQGKVPGLTVTPSSGRPGSSSGINIRGVNSINRGNPLVMVDGVEGDLEIGRAHV